MGSHGLQRCLLSIGVQHYPCFKSVLFRVEVYYWKCHIVPSHHPAPNRIHIGFKRNPIHLSVSGRSEVLGELGCTRSLPGGNSRTEQNDTSDGGVDEPV